MGRIYQVKLLGNCSEINGTLIRIPTTTDPPSNGTKEHEYDHQGAMHFIIATILVYSICGVLCTLINRMKRLRGKSHVAYVQDEHVQRYLKTEKYLKYDGRKSKMMHDCGKVIQAVNKFEERQNLREIEREIASGDFAHVHDVREIQRKNKRKKRKRKSKERDGLSGALGHMGLSLFYIRQDENTHQDNNNIEDHEQVTSGDEAVLLDTDTALNVFNETVSNERGASEETPLSLQADADFDSSYTDIEYADA